MLTKITKDAFAGKKSTGERDNTDHRRLAPRKANRSKTSKPPRTRDGATHPGGKRLRAALGLLDIRRRAFASPENRDNTGPGYKQPGSMKG